MWFSLGLPEVTLISGRFVILKKVFSLKFWSFKNSRHSKTIIPFALVGYEKVIANSALSASLAVYHLICNKGEWNNQADLARERERQLTTACATQIIALTNGWATNWAPEVLCDFQATYNGETGRNLSTRLTEQKQATRNGDVNNHIVEHHLQTKHQFGWDSATCITYSTDYYKRLTLESWFTNLEKNPLSRNQ